MQNFVQNWTKLLNWKKLRGTLWVPTKVSEILKDTQKLSGWFSDTFLVRMSVKTQHKKVWIADINYTVNV